MSTLNLPLDSMADSVVDSRDLKILAFESRLEVEAENQHLEDTVAVDILQVDLDTADKVLRLDSLRKGCLGHLVVDLKNHNRLVHWSIYVVKCFNFKFPC